MKRYLKDRWFSRIVGSLGRCYVLRHPRSTCTWWIWIGWCEGCMKVEGHLLACSRFWWFSLRKHPFLPALSRRGRIARRNVCESAAEFHTDDANQCLHNKSSSHGVPNTNLSNFTCLLVDFGKVLCSSANELQQNSNASSGDDYIPQILNVLLEILPVYIWPLWPFVFCLSFANNT